MTEKEERAWRAILADRTATPDEIADTAGVTPELVRSLFGKIGTPEWRHEVNTAPLRCELLHEASDLTAGDRNKTYGDPVENMQHIADIFNAWTGQNLTARHVAQLHIATKMARRTTSPVHRDSYVDSMAYAGIEYECAIDEDNKS